MTNPPDERSPALRGPVIGPVIGMVMAAIGPVIGREAGGAGWLGGVNAQITTGWVDIAGMTAYTALPVGTRRPVGVLVAGEIFGVSRYARRMPDRLAGLGHVVCSVAGELGLSAAVALYPGWLTGTDLPLSRPEPTLEPAARAPGRLVVLLGADDPIIDARQQEAIGERLETVVYPGAGHGFAADERDSFHPASAREAWRLIEEVLDQVRRSPQTAG